MALRYSSVTRPSGKTRRLYCLELILSPASAGNPTVKRSPDSISKAEIIFSHAGNSGGVSKDDDPFASVLLIEFLVRVGNLIEPPSVAVEVIDRKPVACDELNAAPLLHDRHRP